MVVGFVTFPILTRVLTKEQYAVMGLVIVTMLIAVSVGKMGMSNGIIRYYDEYHQEKEQRDIFVSTVFVYGFLISATTVLVYYILFPQISVWLEIDRKALTYFFIMGAYLLIRPVNIIILNVLRASGKTIHVNVINSISRISGAFLSIVLLVLIVKNLYGYFWGLIIGEGIGSAILFHWLFKTYDIKIKVTSLRITGDLIRFGLPLLFSEISYLLLSYADRYMILIYLDQKELGIYTVGYNMAMYLADLIVFSLGNTVVPLYVAMYNQEGKAKTEEFLSECFHYLAIFIIPICFGFYVCSKEAFIFIASQAYANASEFSYLILIGNMLLGINFIFQAGLFIEKRSWVILIIMICGVASNIVFNIALLPSYGITGAAIATLLSCILTSVITVLVSFKYLCIRFRMLRLTGHFILSSLMMVFVNKIDVGFVAGNLFAKMGIGMVLVTGGVLVLERNIIKNIKGIISRRKAGMI